MRFKPRSERKSNTLYERSEGLTRVIEALLFSAQKPLSIHEITAAIKAAEKAIRRVRRLTSSRA